MKTIKRSEISKEIEGLKKLCEGHKNVNQELIKKLENAGFQHVCLGTGKQSHSSSLSGYEWDLNNSYLSGKYVGIGTASMKYGRGTKYYAYVKQIID